MRDLKIAYGNSRQAKFWSNKTITFEELKDRLRIPIRTSETTAEYMSLQKTQRDGIKDKGGFVAGHLRDNRRKVDHVDCRSMVVYDIDFATPEFIQDIKAKVPYVGCAYSTHSHMPEKPRVRAILPAARDMTPDEHNAIARFVAADMGIIDMIDPCSFEPHQLMYWPSCPSDGEYLFIELDGDVIDPDKILSAHPNWRDCSLLPTTPKESTAKKDPGKKQQDPLAKNGAVGYFCRLFTIEDAIARFLSDIYEPVANMSGRYTYIPGESAAGLVVYENGTFAYSHHATDPAFGKLLNAFDLVRVHKFPDAEDKQSYKDMADFVMSLPEIKMLATKEKLEEAQKTFGETNSAETDDTWKGSLQYMSRSTVLQNSVWNEMLILNNDPDCQGFAYNEMANRVQVTGKVPWDRPTDNKFWRDADTAQLKAMIDIRYVCFSDRNHNVAFTKVADDRRFHPVRNYLNALPAWDGIKRVDDLFIKRLSADDTNYVKAVTRKTLVAAVARIYHPGTKFDTVLVLDGDQGIGKSTMWKSLAGDEYFSDALSLTDMDDKSGAEKLQGFWIIEIGELAGMKRADIEKVKSFMSTSDDKYRPSYGKVVESHPRQCIVVATVNGERGYLRDITGNRRFWIVKCRQIEKMVKWKISPEERDQIWAEVKYYYEQGEKLYLEGNLLEEAEEAQRGAMEADERQGMVEEYLSKLLPENWAMMDLYQRRNFLDGDDLIQKEGTVTRQTVSNAEIWCECFKRNLADMKPTDSYAIVALMTQVDGWERTSRRMRIPIYGQQRMYVNMAQNTRNL
jgi:predicted P-loop ATPase